MFSFRFVPTNPVIPLITVHTQRKSDHLILYRLTFCKSFAFRNSSKDHFKKGEFIACCQSGAILVRSHRSTMTRPECKLIAVSFCPRYGFPATFRSFVLLFLHRRRKEREGASCTSRRPRNDVIRRASIRL